MVSTNIDTLSLGGIATSGVFRLSGNAQRVEHLFEIFANPPLYGDEYPLPSTESPHNLACVLKRWLRDLPEPILDDSIGPALYTFCVSDESPNRIAAARILLQLLPPPNFSIMTYLLAFLSQLTLTIENKLGLNAISIIFGPALIASRANGVPGLGPRSKGCKDPDAVSMEVDRSQKTMAWLIQNWPLIADGIMDCAIPDPLAKVSPEVTTPGLLSPIDLRKNKDGLSDDTLANFLELSFEPTPGMTRSESKGILTKALSSMSISSLYQAGEKAPKRSQSFSNLSGMLKRSLTGGSTKIDPSTIERE